MRCAYDECEALAMCVRLRAARKICPELNDLLGSTLMSIAKMAARILGSKSSDRSILSACEDYDARMLCVYMMLKKIDENAVNTKNPRGIVNYFVKIAQSWIRTIARNESNRQRLRPTRVISDVEFIDAITLNVSDLRGQLTIQPTRRTVCPH